MKVLKPLIMVIFLFLISLLTAKSQEIQFNTIFTRDTVLFPFEQVDLISMMTIEGDVHMHHDTSLVRVIIEDESGYQYMLMEAYPLICPDSVLTFNHFCDETCFLDQANPYSLIIQIIDGSLNLKSLYYDTESKENSVEERYKAKRAMDAAKIEIMNQKIQSYNMKWNSEDNSLVASYYDQKRLRFGDGYNLCGFEYYADGVFEFPGYIYYPRVNPNLVRQFDWRDRHGANDPQSPYWDGDNYGTGWLTSVKDQGHCAGCWAFAPIGTVEALINLYTTQHFDYDLSEQQIISCSDKIGNCSNGHIDSAFVFIKDEGVVTENCCSYLETSPSCDTLNICEGNENDSIVKINEISNIESNQDSARISLITNGPQTIWFDYPGKGGHAVVLTGFEFNPADSTLSWIFKNSWGTDPPGFERMKIVSLIEHEIGNTVFLNNVVFSDTCRDEDGDGYYFWGIGKQPDSCNCDTIEDCNDNDPFVGGYDENYNCSCIFEMDEIPHYISADTVWSDSTYINYQVIIDSGACLTIRSYAAFAPEAGILVRQGGKLILDSAYLTKVCPDLWQGIDVLGRDTIQALDEYFGKVVVQNNSIIEFAEIGIANYCRTCGIQDMQTGGMISAENSIFRDNERDILLYPFKTYWFGHDLPYACTIENCRFITTNNIYPDHSPKVHIEMKDIYGVALYGCIFENQTSPAVFPYSMRGTGISAIDSYFTLEKYCTSPNIPCENFDSCKFAKLEYGIKALNSRSKRTINIHDIEFSNNLLAVSLSGIDYASIISNRFKCPTENIGKVGDRFIGGIFLEGCSSYHVEGDTLIGISDSLGILSPAYGIGVKNSGPDDNEIYNNYFERLSVGIYAIGENRGKESGLCFKCNDMVSNKNDFIVVDVNDPPLGTYQGINRYQGNPSDSTSFDAPAGNTFTSQTLPADPLELKYYNYYNDAEDIWYVHHFSENDLVTPLDSNYTKETIELTGWTLLGYEKETACPSGLGGGGSLKSTFSPRSIIHDAETQIGLLNNQLIDLIDGGNTEELNFEIMVSMPDEGLEITQELITKSPFLSDTVIKQAIYKEDVLPNAMIRDILEANPQAAKSDEVLITLDSRFEPMPEYMIAQIMQNKKFLGAKELLESKIQSWRQIRAKAKADLIREFLLDTNILNPIDSMIAFLEHDDDLQSKYDMAFIYWNISDTTNALETLNNIPLQFSLSENQSLAHEYYLSYFSVLHSMANNNWQAYQLDSASISLLQYLKETGNSRIAALSRGLLFSGGYLDFIETINIPDYSKSSGTLNNLITSPNEIIQDDHLKLFPNPAGDFVIIYYTLESENVKGMISLNDLNGRMIKTLEVNTHVNQIVIDLKGIPNGIYIVALHSDSGIIESEKLSKGGY